MVDVDVTEIVNALVPHVWLSEDRSLVWRNGARVGLKDAMTPLLVALHQVGDIVGFQGTVDRFYSDHEAAIKALSHKSTHTACTYCAFDVKAVPRRCHAKAVPRRCQAKAVPMGAAIPKAAPACCE